MSTRLDWGDVVRLATEARDDCVGAKPDIQEFHVTRLLVVLQEIARKIGSNEFG